MDTTNQFYAGNRDGSAIEVLETEHGPSSGLDAAMIVLDDVLALDAAEGIEVAVLNPKAVNRFAQALRRSKTDAADAQALSEYSRRMPFTPWQAPATQGSAIAPRCLVEDLKHSLAWLERRMAKLRRQTMALVQQEQALQKRFDLMTGIPGITCLIPL